MAVLMKNPQSFEKNPVSRRRFYIPRGNIKLAALLEMPKNNRKGTLPLVIFMHALMMDSREFIFDRIADGLLDNGIAVLRFDFSGHGQSQGKFEDMTVPLELLDGAAVLEFAQTLPFFSEISLLGHSQGGVVASMTAGNYPEKVKSLVLMAPAATMKEDARMGRLAGTRFNPLNIPDYISCFGLRVKGDYARTAQNLPIYEVAENYEGPVCLIHGTADTLVSPKASKKYHEVYKNSSLHLLDGADHEFYCGMSEAVSLAADFLTAHSDIKK